VRIDEEPQAEWPFAVELAAMPEVWRALLELHVSGRDGRCRGCHSQVRSAPHWPCPLYGAAAQARRIAAGTNGTLISGVSTTPPGGTCGQVLSAPGSRADPRLPRLRHPLA
jgi:hypothetical protein